ncbi:MAG: Endonuclease/Exonuclease/phosphatase [Marteilia pararefringens]
MMNSLKRGSIRAGAALKNIVYRHLGPSRLLLLTAVQSTLEAKSASQVTMHIVIRKEDLPESGTSPRDCRFTLSILSLSRLAQLQKSLKKTLSKRSHIPIFGVELISSNEKILSDDAMLGEVLNMPNLNLKLNDKLNIPIYHKAANFSLRQSVMAQTLSQGTYLFPLFDDTYNFDIKNLNCFWYVYENEGIDEELVGKDISLFLKPEFVGKHIKVYCHVTDCNGVQSPTKYLTFNRTVVESMESLPASFNIYQSQLLKSKDIEDKNHLRVGTYNVLGNKYISTIESQQWYDYCPKFYRQTTYRPMRLLTEILTFNCDIMMCQEFENFGNVMEILEIDHGIKSSFNDGIKATSSQYGNDGLSIFFKANKFSLLDSHQGNISELFNEDSSCSKVADLCKKLIPDTKIVQFPSKYQICVLEDKRADKPRVIFMLNCHLKSVPVNDNERLFQMICLICKFNTVIGDDKYNKFEKLFIFGGDFNTIPSGSPVEFLQGKKSLEEIFELNLDLPGVLKINKFVDLMEKNRFKTNLVGKFNDCIDYIFTGESQFDELSIFNPLDYDEKLKSGEKLLPNKGYLSDHLPIIADLKIKS